MISRLGMSAEPAESPWYRDGLRFTCTQCGACCTGAPGFVWVSPDEIAALAEFRHESVDQFGRQFVRQVGDRHSLVERRNGDCIFWDKTAGCTVYEARPIQCRTWPFWPENIAKPQDWERTQSVCPGSGEGAWFSLESIKEAARRSPP